MTGTISLNFVWVIRYKLRAAGNKLRTEGNKLWAEGSRLWAEGSRLWAEGSRLWAAGDKLRAEGDKLWAEAVIEAHGNITIEWLSPMHCRLGNGDEYGECECE